ncbi:MULTISPECIES: precorrin-2 C(20)-methyltransferase [unclassified Bradyrhizobium]|uniref:precorrin-2 C(20)-methyltransferase n=1 Tax=unclassified Bradyrhizobium TaxID=2631580 RepID=UPI0028EA94CE|nr:MULTISPECIES: precorrin-2 C(20)-methyltransferase [unclassified Bradyrhizobium]
MSLLDTIAGSADPGTLYGIGVGPGDVRYLTLRAAGLVRSVDVVAFFAKRGMEGNARRIVAPLMESGRHELRLEYPVTEELPVADLSYQSQIADFYRRASESITAHLGAGRSVGLLSEGDPFFYGSFMHMWRRLERDHPVEVVPGVTGMSGCWTKANVPITWGDDVLSVLPGTLGEDVLHDRLTRCEAAVIMKVGRNLAKVKRAIISAGLLDRALYVERGTMEAQRVAPLAEVELDRGPYFSMILIPGQGRRL